MAKLTKTELLEMELNLERKQNAEKNIELKQLRHNNKMLEVRVRNLEEQLKMKAESEKVRKEVEALKAQLEREKEAYREFNNKIKKKHKLKGSWGINPDTGEILEEE